MHKLTLTAILPNYNHVRYLPVALESVIAQKRPADELIIVDDASTDDSVAVIKAFLPHLPNARLERNATNIGAINVINRAMRSAKGSIVCSINADDVIYPDLFAVGMSLLEQYPHAAIFSARADVLDENGRNLGVLPTPLPINTPGVIDPSTAAQFFMREEAWFMGPTSLYRRAPLEALVGFPADLYSFNDGYISRVLALRHGACFSPAVLAGWRRTPGSMSWSQTMDLATAENVANIVEKRMSTASEIFPRGYPFRWKQRYMFGARRFALIEARRRAARDSIPKFIAALLHECIAVPYLFLTMRPWDLFTVLRRRLQYLFMVRSHANSSLNVRDAQQRDTGQGFPRLH